MQREIIQLSIIHGEVCALTYKSAEEKNVGDFKRKRGEEKKKLIRGVVRLNCVEQCEVGETSMVSLEAVTYWNEWYGCKCFT